MNAQMKHFDDAALKCILTLSPNKSYTNTKNLKAIIELLAKSFNSILVVDSTYNDRWNQMASENYREDQFQSDFSKWNEKFIRKVNKITTEIGKSKEITVFNWKNALENKKFTAIKDDIERYMIKNKQFEKDLLATSIQFYNSLGQKNVSKHHFELSKNYLIEEISLIIYLYLEGFKVEVYPGKDITVFEKIYKKEYEQFPYDLSNRIHYNLLNDHHGYSLLNR